MADHPLKYPRNEGVVHEKPAPGLGETREETLPQTLKEVEVGRGLGQRPSWLARKPLIRRHTQPCRDDPPPTPHAAAAPWFRAARRHSPMGVEPLRAGAQRNLGRGPQRAIGAPSGDAAGPTEIRERSLSHPQILLQSPFSFSNLRRWDEDVAAVMSPANCSIRWAILPWSGITYSVRIRARVPSW